jgi:hypothetical protein
VGVFRVVMKKYCIGGLKLDKSLNLGIEKGISSF